MLWKFYKNDPEACSYIFGTMHMSTKEAYAHVDIAKKYISKTAIFAAEMDMNDTSAHEMIQYFKLPDDAGFSDFFPAKKYQKYRKVILKSLGADISNYENFTPFFINNMMAEMSIEKSEPQPLDHYLWSYALNLGKEMHGVESLGDQVEILRNIPLDIQLKTFKDAVRNITAFRKKIKTFNRLYSNGDIKSLYKISKSSMGKIRKLMIYDRNVKMAQKSTALHEDKPSFIAVGVAHLWGSKGMLSLIKKQGYKLKPM